MPESRPAPIIWSAYEHEHIERGSDWFWALGVIALCASVAALLFGNFLFGLLILVAAGTLGLLANRPPQFHEFEISDRGIRISDELHSYNEVLSFWVETENTKEPLLLVDTTKFMSPNLIIPIGEIDPNTIRALLREHAEEIPMKEPFFHKVLEFFGL